jgi:hypothetical protein
MISTLRIVAIADPTVTQDQTQPANILCGPVLAVKDAMEAIGAAASIIVIIDLSGDVFGLTAATYLKRKMLRGIFSASETRSLPLKMY